MNDHAPTPEGARKALAEVDERAFGVRQSDSRFRFILVALAAVYLAVGIVVGLHPRGGSFAGPAVLAIFACGIAAAAVTFWRIRAYSKAGVLRFVLACSAFTIWNTVVLAVSLASGWFRAAPVGVHFTVTAAVASIPLLVAAWLLAPRRP